MSNNDDNQYIEYEDGTRIKLDKDDSPEWTEEMFKKSKSGKQALIDIIGKKNTELLLSGKVGRPIAENPKKQITLRLDPHIVDEFRSHGKGWQTEINNILSKWISDNRPQA